MIIAPPKAEVFVIALTLGLIWHGVSKSAMDLFEGLYSFYFRPLISISFPVPTIIKTKSIPLVISRFIDKNQCLQLLCKNFMRSCFLCMKINNYALFD